MEVYTCVHIVSTKEVADVHSNTALWPKIISHYFYDDHTFFLRPYMNVY